MAQFQVRGGQTLKVTTRRVSNIVFDSTQEVTLQYVNYYYTPTPSSPEFQEKQKTGIEIDVIRSQLLYDWYEIDYDKNTTTKYFPNGTESGRDISTPLVQPNHFNYSSLFDQHSVGSWYEVLKPENHGRGEFIVLEGNFRKTATLPIKHNGLLNDAFHFHMAGDNFHTNSDGSIVVKVYQSSDSLETATENLEKFYSGSTSKLVGTFNF
jgi:hypothetical protein